jgi:hypothetical protein
MSQDAPQLPPRASRSGSESRQRTEVLQVRLSPEECAELDAAAEAAGLAIASYVRFKLSDGTAPRSVRRPPADLEALRALLAQLGKVGSNVNQIAHKLNAEQSPSAEAVREAVRDVRAMRDAVMLALGYEVDA